MSLATSKRAVPEPAVAGSDPWHQALAVLLIEQGRELCNVMTELPAPVGDGLVHVQDPICPQDPRMVHVGQSRAELVWLLEATVVLVEDLARGSMALVADQPVPGLGPVVAIATRWATAARSLLATTDTVGPGASSGVTAAA